MNMTNYLLMILFAGVLALAGCSKSSDQAPPAPSGVIDLGALQQAFPSGGPEVQKSFDKIRFATRYRQFPLALAELDKLAQMPGLTDAQKKAVNDLIEQVKQTMSTAAAKPAQ
jgi:hypothetical protein